LPKSGLNPSQHVFVKIRQQVFDAEFVFDKFPAAANSSLSKLKLKIPSLPADRCVRVLALILHMPNQIRKERKIQTQTRGVHVCGISDLFLVPHVFSAPLKDMAGQLQEQVDVVERLHTLMGLDVKVCPDFQL